MANLCGANEAIDNALSKALDLKNDILGKLELPASDIAASANAKLTELKSALDGFTVDLPTIPDINVQAEITGLISDIDKTSIQGLIAFNSKVAQLKLDFGDTFKDKGLDLDEIISSGTDLISGGGDICALCPNLDLPASASGTGITTEEIEERGTGTSVTLTQTPKEILSVQGKKSTQTFFTNINYKQNGLVIVPSAAGTYSEIKVTYIVSLIKEKPINSKQADKKEEQETPAIISSNVDAKDTSFAGLIAKFKKDTESASSSKDVSKDLAGIKEAISFIGSPDFKAKQEKDFATWQTEYKKLKADPLNYKPVVTKTGESVKATTIEATVTKERKTDKDGFTYTETKRVTSSDAGFTHRTKDNFIDLVKINTAKEVLAGLDSTKYPDWYETIQEVIDYYEPETNIAEIDLNPYNQPIMNITLIEYVSILRKGLVDPITRVVQPAGIVEEELQSISADNRRLSTKYYEYALGNKLRFKNIAGIPLDLFTDPDIFAITISYKTMDKIDPNYKG